MVEINVVDRYAISVSCCRMKNKFLFLYHLQKSISKCLKNNKHDPCVLMLNDIATFSGSFSELLLKQPSTMLYSDLFLLHTPPYFEEQNLGVRFNSVTIAGKSSVSFLHENGLNLVEENFCPGLVSLYENKINGKFFKVFYFLEVFEDDFIKCDFTTLFSEVVIASQNKMLYVSSCWYDLFVSTINKSTMSLNLDNIVVFDHLKVDQGQAIFLLSLQDMRSLEGTYKIDELISIVSSFGGELNAGYVDSFYKLTAKRTES